MRDRIDEVTPAKRRRDAETLLALFARATHEEPAMWSSIVGYGTYHYRYDSGREGDAPAAGFAPRKAATVVYLNDGVGTYADLLEELGPHTTGVGCLYLKDLEAVRLDVLEQIVQRSYTALTSGTYTQRAREGGTQA
ncbi:DUF1801 domain-containing protein [Myceligenerans sp. TRM 65318]|uniref:DUF1801 domain-containing protein n=1 Tax=Myceligenerans pegani TaxID=2776917 RepID=A0ABR9MVT2_9MICO|nr:DUF1801 domain-containing protein [Myceligenerans sp. TRM 65318]MBE1875490.1 DUF1801 domain-containing protein [Myceligenerans sp. TRM 65318]MBE3017761.1 DUF1801 domain-containing protein [Myceligenerans sp. TRM 65318]